MTDTSTTTDTTKEKTMSDTATETKKTKKAKKTNGADGVPELAKLEKLPRGMTRSVQETFRATPEEHNTLVAEASKEKFGSMSDFYRARLGLDD